MNHISPEVVTLPVETGELRQRGRRSIGPEPLLESALDLFRSVGYHGATVRDIAKGADVTVAAVYHHFQSKQEILVSIMRRAMEENLAVTRLAAGKRGQQPSVKLSNMVSAVVRFHTTHQKEAFVGNSELRSLEDQGRAVIVTLRDEAEQLFVDVINEGANTGVFTVKHTKQAARSILSMTTAVASWYRAEGSLTVEELCGQYIDLSLNLVGYTGPR